MRTFYKPPKEWKVSKAETYFCDHPIYRKCTLYKKNGVGLAVVQRRFNKDLKLLFWSTIDPYLIDDIYSRPGFDEYFSKHAKECTDGLYPTVELRKLMWSLRMPPLKKKEWEKFT